MKHSEIAEFFELDAVALAEKIRQNDVRPEALLQEAARRAQKHNAAFNALSDIDEATGEKLLAKTDTAAALYGVPTLIKDLGAEAVDFHTNSGSQLFARSNVSQNSSIYDRMRQAGLVPFGRTTSPEFGVGPVTEAGFYGAPTRNPWNSNHTCGGSSGGSGAAVAAGIVPVAHGSDGGGSVRIPASCCGLVGFKPTRARLPDGLFHGEGWAGMAIDGFLSRSLRDTAVLLDSCAGPDLGAPYYAPPLNDSHVAALEAKRERLKILYLDRDFAGNPIHEECARAVAQAADALKNLGHDVHPWRFDIGPEVQKMMRAWTKIVAAGVHLAVRSKIGASEPDSGAMDGVTLGAFEYGKSLLAADYLEAVGVIHGFGRTMADVFRHFDVLLSPTLAQPPAAVGRYKPTNQDFVDYRNGADGVFAYSPYTAVFNASGQPAISLPTYWSADDLPIGVHLAAEFGADELLLNLSSQMEQNVPWAQKQQQLIRRLNS
ncbi:MAG: amidase [Paracoccaceae bacterium]|nr:amidase [Paracoccaceae bacterium]